MPQATIYRPGEKVNPLVFNLPEPRPKPGDVYVWKEYVRTLGEQDFEPGDTMEVIEMTMEYPHGILCTAGNWVIKTKFSTSVWSNFELAISEGRLARMPTVWERLNAPSRDG